MTSRLATRAAAAVAFVLAAAAGPSGLGRVAVGASITVGLIGPRNDHLVEEIARELVSARLSVTLVGAEGDVPPDGGLAALPAPLVYGVVVAPDDRRVVVLARGAPGAASTRTEIEVDPRDRLARRRACIAVVEYLRVLTEGSRQPTVVPSDGAPPPPAEPMPAPPPPNAPLDVAAPPPPPVAPAAAGGRATPVVRASAPRRGPPPPVDARPPVVVVATTPGRTDDRGRAVPTTRWWSMGVATTLDLSGAQSGATSHVQFLWRAPLGAHLVLRGRGLWPLLGGSADDGLMEMRTWTFGVATDLQLTFADPAARVRPFVGATVGGHLILTEINSPAHSDNRSAFTPTATLGLQAGLGYRVTATIEVFVEVGAARDWLVPGVQRSGYEATIANATSLHSAIGAMFDY